MLRKLEEGEIVTPTSRKRKRERGNPSTEALVCGFFPKHLD